jgi:hypothetical protein
MMNNPWWTNQVRMTQQEQSSAKQLFLAQLRKAIWLIGIPLWLFSLADRSIVALEHGLSKGTVLTILTIVILFISWLSLKPDSKIENENNTPSESYRLPSDFHPSTTDLEVTQLRMAELQNYHLISQAYKLPFPYLCQIYHLLNLKHLETIHSFSLNNLKVVNVSYIEPTERGGVVKFQTVLESPFNVLRMWRKSTTEAQLTLHNPYTVELAIPVYGNKVVIVLFNALPLSQNEHQFCVDIYSNLNWYKPLLKVVLHFASVLTLIEDLPYLQAIAQKNVQRLAKPERNRSDTMWLFGRFVGLYGTVVSCIPQLGAESKLERTSSPAE